MHPEIEAIQERVKEQSGFCNTLLSEVGKVIVGQTYLVERLLIGLLADGHLLLEGVPGLAKTLLISTGRRSAPRLWSSPRGFLPRPKTPRST